MLPGCITGEGTGLGIAVTGVNASIKLGRTGVAENDEVLEGGGICSRW